MCKFWDINLMIQHLPVTFHRGRGRFGLTLSRLIFLGLGVLAAGLARGADF